MEAAIGAPSLSLSAATHVELDAVVDSRRNAVLSRHLDTLLETLGAQSVPLDAEQTRIARAAYRDVGRGSGHKAPSRATSP